MLSKTYKIKLEPAAAKPRQEISIRSRLNSFSYAWNGIIHFFKTEMNARIHLGVTVLVILAGFYFRLNMSEAIAICFAIALVWIAEMINTAIEKTMDMITVQKHPQVKIIKDISAGAVLVAAIAALVTGAIVFIPKLLLI